MTEAKPEFAACSRRTFMHLGAGVPLAWALPGTAQDGPPPVFLATRAKVPDPHIVRFTVQYPGKEPLTLVGHFWFNIDVLQDGRRCPAIVEFHPYRRRDGSLALDSQMYPWFAYNEYLCFRIDLQGSGDSDGLMTDEYSDEELHYCTQVIEQIARHPLCDGKVGLMGKSWSAINALMVAARPDAPAALTAVVAASGSDDRYNDDVHYMGGALLFDNLTWPSIMWGFLAQPPDPEVVGERWQQLWRQRVEQANFWFEPWASHQTRDGYWQRGSVRDHYERLKVPVFVSSGWQDHYKNTVGRLLHGVDAAGGTACGVLGPWGHEYPYSGAPGPQLDWLHYLVTHWWDRWLKGKTPDPKKSWPQLLLWLNASREPTTSACGDEQGRWVAEDGQWADRVEDTRFYLGSNHKLRRHAEQATYTVPAALLADLALLDNGSLGACGIDDLPGDQTATDRQALSFDSDPFDADLDCYGQPVLTLHVRCAASAASLAVRLCEISPQTGASHLVSYRFFNLCYRDGDMAAPRPIEPGQPFSLHIPLNVIGHTFKRGWRLRLSLSSSLFPTLWSARAAAPILIDAGQQAAGTSGAACISLPKRLPRAQDAGVAALVASAPGIGTRVDPQQYVPILQEGRRAQAQRQVTPWQQGSATGLRIHKHLDRGRYLYGGPLDSLWTDQVIEQEYAVLHDDPRSLVCTTSCVSILERPKTGWWTKAAATTRIWCGQEGSGQDVFYYEATLNTFIRNSQGQEEPFAQRTVRGYIPRQWT